jgi:hypothetical protein
MRTRGRPRVSRGGGSGPLRRSSAPRRSLAAGHDVRLTGFVVGDDHPASWNSEAVGNADERVVRDDVTQARDDLQYFLCDWLGWQRLAGGGRGCPARYFAHGLRIFLRQSSGAGVRGTAPGRLQGRLFKADTSPAMNSVVCVTLLCDGGSRACWRGGPRRRCWLSRAGLRGMSSRGVWCGIIATEIPCGI